MRYIEKMGVEWAANDITTLERADERIANMQTYGESWKRVSQIIGMYNSGYPTKAQQENSNRWVNEWKFSDEMIKEAYERCVSLTFHIQMVSLKIGTKTVLQHYKN